MTDRHGAAAAGNEGANPHGAQVLGRLGSTSDGSNQRTSSNTKCITV